MHFPGSPTLAEFPIELRLQYERRYSAAGATSEPGSGQDRRGGQPRRARSSGADGAVGSQVARAIRTGTCIMNLDESAVSSVSSCPPISRVARKVDLDQDGFPPPRPYQGYQHQHNIAPDSAPAHQTRVMAIGE